MVVKNQNNIYRRFRRHGQYQIKIVAINYI